MKVEKKETINLTKANRNLKHLPGDYGLPLFGRTFDFVRDPGKLFKEMYQKYGSVHRSSFLFRRYVALLGPDYAQIVLMDKEKNFSSRGGWHDFIGRFFNRGLMLMDFEEHRLNRRIMQEAFKTSALRDYTKGINKVVDLQLKEWSRLSVSKLLFYPQIKQMTLNIASTVFIGVNMKEKAEKINKAFVDASGGGIATIKFPVPGLKFYKALRGREYLEKVFYQLVPERRGTDGKDMLTQLCNAIHENGEKYSDEDVVNHIIFMLLAAHDTVASALTNMVYELSINQQWQQKMREECFALESEQLNYEDLSKLEYAGYGLKETLRLYAPVALIPRRTVRECKINGTFLPANTHIWIAPDFNHHMSEWWPEPDKFDPERFSKSRAENTKHTYSWIPYGGGAHKCIGMYFSEIVVKAFMYQLLRKYRFAVSGGHKPNYQHLPFPKPKDNLPIIIECIKR